MSMQGHEPAPEAGEDIPPKPKRPLTTFNLFGKLERNYIVQTSLKRAHISATPESTTSESSDISVHEDPYLNIRPAKYRDIEMPHDWYKVGRNKTKRQCYQIHGVIEFQQLSKLVADRWNKIDAETKQFLDTIYACELIEYRKEVVAYMKKYGKEAFDAQKATYNKRKAQDDTTTVTSGSASNASSNNLPASRRPVQNQNTSAAGSHSQTSAMSETIGDSSHGYAMIPNDTAATQLNQLRNAYLASLQGNLHQSSVSAGNPEMPFQGYERSDTMTYLPGGYSLNQGELQSTDTLIQTNSPYDMVSNPITAGAQSNQGYSAAGQIMYGNQNPVRGLQSSVGFGFDMNGPFHNASARSQYSYANSMRNPSMSIQTGGARGTDHSHTSANAMSMYSTKNTNPEEWEYGQPVLELETTAQRTIQQPRSHRSPKPEQSVHAMGLQESQYGQSYYDQPAFGQSTGFQQFTAMGQTFQDSSFGSANPFENEYALNSQGQVNPHHQLPAERHNQMAGHNWQSTLTGTMYQPNVPAPEPPQLQRQGFQAESSNTQRSQAKEAGPKTKEKEIDTTRNSDSSGSSGSRLSDILRYDNSTEILVGPDLEKTFDSESS
jgi:hypothetical protein